jgi:prepilin-type N-terminal cleavage/methylation domain-containing protein
MQRLSIRERISERRGLNLIELAIVMAVVGLIIGGIYIAASSVYRNVRESTTQEDILQIVQNTKSTYGVQGTIPGGAILATTAISAGLVPADMNQNNNLIDAFGGAVVLTGVAGPPAEIQISLANVPQSVCSDLLVKDSAGGVTGAAASGLVSIQGGGAAILAANFPITPLIAIGATNCGTAAVDTVIFTYTIN